MLGMEDLYFSGKLRTSAKEKCEALANFFEKRFWKDLALPSPFCWMFKEGNNRRKKLASVPSPVSSSLYLPEIPSGREVFADSGEGRPLVPTEARSSYLPDGLVLVSSLPPLMWSGPRKRERTRNKKSDDKAAGGRALGNKREIPSSGPGKCRFACLVLKRC